MISALLRVDLARSDPRSHHHDVCVSASVRKADDLQAGGQCQLRDDKRTFALAYDPQASMHQQDGPLDATERIFGTAAENELA